ncbi:unnamed protein product [Adineta ricciae]|uniref:Uncharacterized protein n=1 Tax=Adineta ricciae TaxID=249248 RepID=A0A815HA67_ADIRI|nr:unnamed protein product [Adineta ricciae]CAF1349456.1 unnamed protein product [Adineta ricciae]
MARQWFISTLINRCSVKLSSLFYLLILLLVIAAAFFIKFGLNVQKSTAHPVFIFSSSRRPTTTTITTFPSPQLTNKDCKRLDFEGLRLANSTNPIPPIYDFFIFNDELDLLEIRLYELYNYVTLFLIVESEITLSGKPKRLYLKENWQKFARYHEKMRRFEVELDQFPESQWSNEITLREDGLRIALQNRSGDTILLTSDVDEIPTAHFLNALTSCELSNPFQPLVLICAYYYYSFEFRRGTTEGATVTFLTLDPAEQAQTISGKTLRDNRFSFQRMPSSCYHCSWCFDRINLTRSKLGSFSHTELNRPEYQKQDHILARYREGKDLFNRASEVYVRLDENDEIPELVKAQRDRFAYLWNRTALVNVGFRDVIVESINVSMKNGTR